MRTSAHSITVGVQQSAGRYSTPVIRLGFGNEDPHFLDLDDAILLHKRLGSFLTKHTSPQRRRKTK